MIAVRAGWLELDRARERLTHQTKVSTMRRIIVFTGLIFCSSTTGWAQFEADGPETVKPATPVITPNRAGGKLLQPGPLLPSAPVPNAPPVANPGTPRSNRFEAEPDHPNAPSNADPNNTRRGPLGTPSTPMIAPPTPFGPNHPANPRLGPDEPFVFMNDLGLWKIAPAYSGKVAGKATYRWFDGETYVDRMEFLAYGRVIDFADAGIAAGTRVPVWAYRAHDNQGNQIYFYFGVEPIPTLRRGERYFPMYYSYDPPTVANPERVLTASGTKRF